MNTARAIVISLVAGCVWMCGGVIQSAIGQEPDSAQVVRPEDLLESALEKLDSGDITEAANLFRKIRSQAPDLPGLKLLEGLLYVETRDAPKAIAALGEFNKNAGSEYRGYAAVGRLYAESRMFRQAVRPLQRAKELAPIEVQGRAVKADIGIELATVLHKLKRTEQALSEAAEAERLSPNDPDIQVRTGEMHLALQDYEAALVAAEKGITLGLSKSRVDPFNRDMLTTLKAAFQLKVNVAKAQRAADPDDATAYFILAQGTRDLAEIARRLELLHAREYLIEALNNDSKRTEWRLLLARVNFELGGLQDALQEVNRILEDDPNHEAAAQLQQDIQERFRGE